MSPPLLPTATLPRMAPITSPLLWLGLQLSPLSAFVVRPGCRSSSSAPSTAFTMYPLFVTEEEVIDQVEVAERLWEEALEARMDANALADQAQEMSEAAVVTASEADILMKEQPISVENLMAADEATNANLDAGSILSRAVAAAEEADLLEGESLGANESEISWMQARWEGGFLGPTDPVEVVA